MIKVRKHRGGLDESMKTVREVETFADLVGLIRESLAPFSFHVEPWMIRVEPYRFDPRIGWDTHLITIEGYGVWGMSNAPFVDAPA